MIHIRPSGSEGTAQVRAGIRVNRRERIFGRLYYACVALICAAALRAQQPAADWKYYGSSKIGDDVDIELFYSKRDVKRLPSGHIEVWTKGLSETELEAARNVMDKNKALFDRVVAKFMANYQPPASKLVSLNQDQIIAMTSSEEIANDADIQPQMRVLYEMDCPGKLFRELDTFIVIGGKTESSERASEWHRVAPETNGANLLTLLCTSG